MADPFENSDHKLRAPILNDSVHSELARINAEGTSIGQPLDGYSTVEEIATAFAEANQKEAGLYLSMIGRIRDGEEPVFVDYLELIAKHSGEGFSVLGQPGGAR